MAAIIKRSVKISGHATSVSLEEPFWAVLKTLARDKNLSLNEMISEIDHAQLSNNLSSAVRLYILQELCRRSDLRLV